LLSLSEMRSCPMLEEMVVLKKGSRLSITPVTASEWKAVTDLLGT
jgi:predicted RNA-binding protein with PUA-like domain